METVINWIADKWAHGLGDTWRWFNSLNTDEWLIVLGVVCVLGFLCMRGTGSRAEA